MPNSEKKVALSSIWLSLITGMMPYAFILSGLIFFFIPKEALSYVETIQENDGILNISVTISSQGWEKNFNPLVTDSLPSTNHFMFEPLAIYKTMDNGTVVHRLARHFFYSQDFRSITYVLRKGVVWSDGKPFGADDVLFTYNLIKEYPVLDKMGLWKNTIKTVHKKDDHTVVFILNDVNTSAEWQIAQQPIVPEHQWRHIKNPVLFKNETPVGTGPFTEISHFSDHMYVQTRNPHYWEKGKPGIDGIRLLAFSGNQEALTALIQGDIDWGGIFIPNIEASFIQKNPKHHHYWFPPGAMISLYMNATIKPFNDIRFRKALSMAINRDSIVQTAMYGYALASRQPSGIGELYHSWLDDKNTDSYGKTGTYAPYESVTLLNRAGYLDYDNDGFRENPDGTDLTISITAPEGWTDWETACKIIAAFFNEIGIQTRTEFYPFPLFNQNLIHSEFMVAMCGGDDGPSPWITYFKLFGKGLRKDYRGGQNWCNYTDHEAEQLIHAYVKSNDPGVHKTMIKRLQNIVAETVPIIPLFSSPSWYEYNDSRFTGWANADNPFVMPTFFRENPERLLHVLNLSRVKPKKLN